MIAAHLLLYAIAAALWTLSATPKGQARLMMATLAGGVVNGDHVLENNKKSLITVAAIIVVLTTLAILYTYTLSNLPITTTIPAAYSSFSSISNRSFQAIQDGNISVIYNISVGYPSQYGRLLHQELISFNKTGNNTRTGVKTITMQYPFPPNPFFEVFYINGNNYVCSESVVGNSNFTCVQNNVPTPPVFVILQNYTFEIASNATNVGLGKVSQLKFEGNATYYNTTYMGYNTSYFHDRISYPNNTGINGTVTIYTSLQYGIPLLYLIRLNDPAYNQSNNTVVISMKLESLSRNVTIGSVIPEYLSRFIAANQ